MHYDHIVVGAGTMGMAAGYFLAREGKNVLLLDAFQPPHAKGSNTFRSFYGRLNCSKNWNRCRGRRYSAEWAF